MKIFENVTELVAADGTRYYEVDGLTLLNDDDILVVMREGLTPSKEALEASLHPDELALDGPQYHLIREGSSLSISVH